jgi:hypothetical protein
MTSQTLIPTGSWLIVYALSDVEHTVSAHCELTALETARAISTSLPEISVHVLMERSNRERFRLYTFKNGVTVFQPEKRDSLHESNYLYPDFSYRFELFDYAAELRFFRVYNQDNYLTEVLPEEQAQEIEATRTHRYRITICFPNLVDPNTGIIREHELFNKGQSLSKVFAIKELRSLLDKHSPKIAWSVLGPNARWTYIDESEHHSLLRLEVFIGKEPIKDRVVVGILDLPLTEVIVRL